jgi:hypothetical protein
MSTGAGTHCLQPPCAEPIASRSVRFQRTRLASSTRMPAAACVPLTTSDVQVTDAGPLTGGVPVRQLAILGRVRSGSSLAMTMAGTTEPLSGDAPSHDTPSSRDSHAAQQLPYAVRRLDYALGGMWLPSENRIPDRRSLAGTAVRVHVVVKSSPSSLQPTSRKLDTWPHSPPTTFGAGPARTSRPASVAARTGPPAATRRGRCGTW